MMSSVMRYVSNELAGQRTKKVAIDDEPRLGCRTLYSADIEVQAGEDGPWIEFGSYGLREADRIGHWVYGTGVPLPRVSWLKSHR